MATANRASNQPGHQQFRPKKRKISPNPIPTDFANASDSYRAILPKEPSSARQNQTKTTVKQEHFSEIPQLESMTSTQLLDPAVATRGLNGDIRSQNVATRDVYVGPPARKVAKKEVKVAIHDENVSAQEGKVATQANVKRVGKKNRRKDKYCPHCDRAPFDNSKDLKRHVDTHFGIKRHQCALCGKSFTQIGNRNRHQRLHYKEKGLVMKMVFPVSAVGKQTKTNKDEPKIDDQPISGEETKTPEEVEEGLEKINALFADIASFQMEEEAREMRERLLCKETIDSIANVRDETDQLMERLTNEATAFDVTIGSTRDKPMEQSSCSAEISDANDQISEPENSGLTNSDDQLKTKSIENESADCRLTCDSDKRARYPTTVVDEDSNESAISAGADFSIFNMDKNHVEYPAFHAGLIDNSIRFAQSRFGNTATSGRQSPSVAMGLTPPQSPSWFPTSQNLEPDSSDGLGDLVFALKRFVSSQSDQITMLDQETSSTSSNEISLTTQTMLQQNGSVASQFVGCLDNQQAGYEMPLPLWYQMPQSQVSASTSRNKALSVTSSQKTLSPYQCSSVPQALSSEYSPPQELHSPTMQQSGPEMSPQQEPFTYTTLQPSPIIKQNPIVHLTSMMKQDPQLIMQTPSMRQRLLTFQPTSPMMRQSI